jgi:hypothetical protein
MCVHFIDEIFDGMSHRERLGSRQYHHPVDFATECGELEDPPYARTIGNPFSILSYVSRSRCLCWGRHGALAINAGGREL